MTIWVFIGGVFFGFLGGIGLAALAQIAREVEAEAEHLYLDRTVDKRLERLRESPNQWP